MNLYRNKNNSQLYTIVHLILDIKHLNMNGFAGIYATPYNWDGEQITHIKQVQYDRGEQFNPTNFLNTNFERVAILSYL